MILASPELRISEEIRIDPPATVTISEQGTPMTLAWRSVAGVTGVEVDSAGLTLLPMAAGHIGLNLGTLTGDHDGTALEIPIPNGPRPIRSLHLNGLNVERDGDLAAIRNESDLGGWRIAVAVKLDGSFGPPVVAAPAIGQKGERPALLTGAGLSQRSLRLPDLNADALRLIVVEGDAPEEFERKRFTLTSVSARAAPWPLDLEVLDDTGATVWASPGPTAGAVNVDVRNSVSRALQAAAESDADLRTAITLKARVGGQLKSYGLDAGGRVLRGFDGKIETDLAGDRAPIVLPAPTLAARAPYDVSADLVIRHHGLQLDPGSDPVPVHPGGLGGVVVSGAGPAVRILPPAALREERLRRVGIIGLLADAAEVTVRLMEAVGDQTAGMLGDEFGTASVDAPAAKAARPLQIVWIDLPGDHVIDRPVAIEVSVAAGRLLWAAGSGGPLVRLAVAHEPTPADFVRLGGKPFPLSGPRTEAIRAVLPADAFRDAGPFADSNQFCTLVLRNLVLRYRP